MLEARRLFVKSILILVQRFLKAFAIQLLGVAYLKVELLYKLRMKEMHHRRANRFILVKQVFFLKSYKRLQVLGEIALESSLVCFDTRMPVLRQFVHHDLQH